MISTKNRDMTERVLICLIVLVSVALCILLMIFMAGVIGDYMAAKAAQEEVHEQEEFAATIEISAVSDLVFIAGEREQQVDFVNYAENDFAICAVVYMSDGTELLRTGLILPGETATEAVLSAILGPGVYPNATIVYEIYELDGDGTVQSCFAFPVEITSIE